ncbi:MAG: hypothetical protein AAGI30_01555 [Planctomycetota bacterium]
MARAATVMLSGLALGCAGGSSPPQGVLGEPGQLGTSWPSHGQRADVAAAVSYASAASDMAVIAERPLAEGRDDAVVYELITIRDEPAWLVIEGLGPADPLDAAHHEESTRLTASARVGRFGDPAREETLIARLHERLQQLRRGPSKIDWTKVVGETPEPIGERVEVE